jgi:RNA polymerase sigma-70 factor (ECF subfamily)
MESDDLALLERVAAGDEEALRELTERYRAPLRRYLWRQLRGDARAVEEAVQDVFVAVWRGAAGYRGDAKVVTWLFQIARYLALRARRKELRHAGDVSLTLEDGDERQADWLSASYEDEVVDRLALAGALEQLSEKHREALELVFFFGFSADEVARILETPVGTVKSRVSYARRALLLALGGAPAKPAKPAKGRQS